MIQIRRGLFETNSSSSHSLQIDTRTQEDIHKSIVDSIIEHYSKFLYSDPVSHTDFLSGFNNSRLTIEGLNIPDGGENACVYAIISSWMAKAQYLAMYFFDRDCYISNVEEKYMLPPFKTTFVSHHHYSNLELSSDEKHVLNIIATILVDHLKEAYNINITEVVYNLTNETGWVDGGSFEREVDEYYKTSEDFEKVVKKLIFDDNVTFVYSDEAYHPYSKPEIYEY